MRRLTARQLLLLCVTCAASARMAHAQRPSADDSGSVVRIRTARAVVEGVEPRNTSRGAGMLLRRQGTRQRADMLTSIDDTSGSAWIDLSESPGRLLLHDVPSRLTVSMRFADLRRMFTDMLQARIDSATTEAEELGDGPRVLGHATRRVVYRHRFRMVARRGNVTQTTRVQSETDALVAPDLPEAWGAGSVLSLTAGNASALVDQIFGTGGSTVMVRNGARLPHGLTLRSVTRSSTQIEGNGAILGPSTSSVTVDTAEVVSIERRMLPAALFEQPEGYRVREFGDELQQLITLLDEMSAVLGPGGKSGKPLPGQKSGKPPKPPKPVKP